MPQFVQIFNGHEDILPLPTKILLFLSYFMRTFWYILLAGIIGGVWSFWTMIHTQWGEGLKRIFAQIPNPQWNDAG